MTVPTRIFSGWDSQVERQEAARFLAGQAQLRSAGEISVYQSLISSYVGIVERASALRDAPPRGHAKACKSSYCKATLPHFQAAHKEPEPHPPETHLMRAISMMLMKVVDRITCTQRYGKCVSGRPPHDISPDAALNPGCKLEADPQAGQR